MAAEDGARDVSSHSPRKNRPLRADVAGTSTAGRIHWPPREVRPTRTIDTIDAATSIVGSAVKSSDARNSASRVAFPLTSCAVTTAAQAIAVAIERELPFMRPPSG